MKKLSKEEIEKLADEYATEQNSAYTNDFYGFIAGINKAFELCEVNNCFKEVIVEKNKDKNRDWLGESF